MKYAQIKKLLFLITLIVGYAAYAQVDPVEELFSLINERFSYMKDVAAWKIDNNSPIENKEREKTLLESATKKAAAEGIAPSSIESFFKLQIEIEKSIQTAWQKEWEKEGQSKPEAYMNLKTAIRPELIRLGDTIIFQIKTALPELKNPELYPYYQSLINKTIDTTYVSKEQKQELLSPLLQVELQTTSKPLPTCCQQAQQEIIN